MKAICKHGDPLCPCPDGDLCHYEGKDAWPPPRGLNPPYIPKPVLSGPLIGPLRALHCPRCGNGNDGTFEAETKGVGSQPSKETKLVGWRCRVCQHVIPEGP